LSQGYTTGMDINDHSSHIIQEAINFETLLLSTKKSESSVEHLFEQIGNHISLHDPLTLHPNTYAEAIEYDVRNLLELHSWVKARFLRLEPGDMVMKRSDAWYPEHIAKVPGSPRYLYARGDISLLTRKCVCVVGTRNPSNEGKEYTRETVRALSANDVVIVSGLALGIDGIAHVSALALESSTIAVIGTSLIDTYPTEHRTLQEMIGKRGLLISRFSPAVQTQKWHFLLRNQLMSSVAEGTIVVEDRDGGGAVKQAFYALEQNRRVVLFQHVLDNRSLLWPRRLMIKPGVMVVKRPDAIHARLFAKGREKVEISSKKEVPEQLSLFDLS